MFRPFLFLFGTVIRAFYRNGRLAVVARLLLIHSVGGHETRIAR